MVSAMTTTGGVRLISWNTKGMNNATKIGKIFGIIKVLNVVADNGTELHHKVNLEEVNSQIALEYGQAMTVRVLKADGEIMPIVVVQNATVLDLKKAIRRFMGGNNNVKAE
ncbi:hypothetical protein F7725_009461 [Dissostichus mawsoni]|uniref:SNRNP25 ubiquitin-like domain-containing protein n=1 Tax=Dissostichus mawsoni TaxID=36200 RepID=A0A7J5XLG7_DISMA|nr:hypothetical protein F7725_009461 [Dissostichus mawsoni]